MAYDKETEEDLSRSSSPLFCSIDPGELPILKEIYLRLSSSQDDGPLCASKTIAVFIVLVAQKGRQHKIKCVLNISLAREVVHILSSLPSVFLGN